MNRTAKVLKTKYSTAKPRLAVVTMVLCAIGASQVNAHDKGHHNSDYHTNDGCSFDLNLGVNIGKDQVVFSKKDSPTFILESGQISRDGTKLELTKEQKKLVADYEKQTRVLVPQVVDVTMNGLAIGADATVGAFSMLLGPNHESIAIIQKKFDGLGEEVQKRMNNEFLPPRPLSVQKEDYNFVDDGADLGWSILGATFSVLGQAMRAAADDDYKNAWEAKMKAFEEEFETKIEAKADVLEVKAKAMCETLKSMDAIETLLANSHKELSDFNLVRLRVNNEA